MDIHVDNTLTWSGDEDADHYHLKMVLSGAGTSGAAVGEILNHTAVVGAVVDPTEGGTNSVPAASLIGAATKGTAYDIFIRGIDAAGDPGPWSDPLPVTVVSNVAKVINLVIV